VPAEVRGGRSRSDASCYIQLALPSLATILPSFILLVCSLSFHEAAHAWMADRLGDPTARQLGRLTLNPLAHVDWIGTVLFPLIAMSTGAPLIGWAKPVPVDFRNLASPRRDFALVAAAGPVSNLLLAAILAAVRAVLVSTHPVPGGSADFATEFLLTGIVLNVLLAVFNMIPVPPLDGGNVAIGILPPAVGRLFIALRPYGFLILYALMLTGVLWAITQPVQNMILRWVL
jgi:Zn-dependent protease